MTIRKNIFFSFLAFLAIILTGLMIIYPQATFTGANHGLKTWVTVLVPALLPFFIIADILVEIGVVNFLGVLLEPLMRPLFRLPGAAGFVLAMGFTSGFPMGAVLTNTLYEKDLVKKEEAARLIAFTNNSSPLFLLVAIPVGMFNNPQLGLLLLISHYLANILLGILLGLLPNSFRKNIGISARKDNILKKSIQELMKIQRQVKPLGSILGNSVSKSMQNIFFIGGFVVFFAVLIEVFKVTGIFALLTKLSAFLISLVGLNQGLGEAVTTGFFEMTLGAQTASKINASLIEQLMVVSLILGWSGLSIQAQVSSIAAKNEIPIKFYLCGRIFQGLAAFTLTALLFKHCVALLPVFQIKGMNTSPLSIVTYYIITTKIIFGIIGVLLLLSLLIGISKRISLQKN
ncbi:MAG: sporulation integral membrane protein YlbJ [Peptococcaceae bacterium]